MEKYIGDKTLQANNPATDLADGYKMESAIHKVSHFFN